MSNFYEVLRQSFELSSKTYSVEMRRTGIIPARSVEDALVIAKALGHLAPIVRPVPLAELAS